MCGHSKTRSKDWPRSIYTTEKRGNLAPSPRTLTCVFHSRGPKISEGVKRQDIWQRSTTLIHTHTFIHTDI